MSNFTSPVQLTRLGTKDDSGRPLYRLQHELRYEIGCKGSGIEIVVPAGRITNLATVPRTRFLSWLYRDIVRIDGKYIAAPVLHDYLCNEEYPGILQSLSGFSRFESDAFLRSAMRAVKAPRWQRISVYYAVRVHAIVRGIE